jgi:hypothetical protein
MNLHAGRSTGKLFPETHLSILIRLHGHPSAISEEVLENGLWQGDNCFRIGPLHKFEHIISIG